MSKFIWTQSAIKDLEKPETCPTRWKAQWIDRLFKSKTSEPAEYGNYFEYLCIGANAKGEVTTDLPRNKDGTKTATQKRIEQQAELFKLMFDPKVPEYLGYDIADTQVKLVGEINGIPIEGTADFTGTLGVLTDLKLTEDLDNVRTPYGWGNPIEQLDLLQQILYSQLYEQQFGVKPNKVNLLIFEHGTQMRVKIINLNISESKIESCVERVTKAQEVVNHYDTNGWVVDPNKKECESCKLTDCKARYITQKIQVVNINY